MVLFTAAVYVYDCFPGWLLCAASLFVYDNIKLYIAPKRMYPPPEISNNFASYLAFGYLFAKSLDNSADR